MPFRLLSLQDPTTPYFTCILSQGVGHMGHGGRSQHVWMLRGSCALGLNATALVRNL